MEAPATIVNERGQARPTSYKQSVRLLPDRWLMRRLLCWAEAVHRGEDPILLAAEIARELHQFVDDIMSDRWREAA